LRKQKGTLNRELLLKEIGYFAFTKKAATEAKKKNAF
jgi:hypothetical protein